MLSKESRLVTVQDAAKILSMNEQVLYRMASDGRLPCYRIGRALRLDLNELEVLLREKGDGAQCTTHQ